MTNSAATPRPIAGQSAGRCKAKTYCCSPPQARDSRIRIRPEASGHSRPSDPGLAPTFADSLARGAELLRIGRPVQALEAFDHAVSLDCDDPAGHLNRAVVLRRFARHAEAMASFERATQLGPDWPETHHGLGRLHLDRGAAEAAFACFARATELAPEWNVARHHLAVALQRLGRDDEAVAEYECLVDAGSTDWQTHNNLAFLLLRRGDFRRGFRELEWRFQTQGETPPRLNRHQPVWHGEPLDGRTLLLCEEQGAGDMIQFVRLASRVQNLSGRVLVECGRPLQRLFESVPAVDGCVEPDTACPEADVQLPLLSLPRRLDLALGDVPSEVPYVSASPDPALPSLAGLDSCLAPFAGRLKVGLVWAGSPDNAMNGVRSCAPEALAPLAAVRGVELFSLQFAQPDEIARRLDGLPIHSLAPWLGDFAHTAAVIQRLDLIVTVDTSMAHLSGALGFPTWVLLHTPDPDWRWLEGRDESPWYPSLRLFRQPGPGDWAGIVRDVAAALGQLRQRTR